ncbi:MAG: hypothetical protein MUF22_01860 [Chitinispirillaceae bacterium]|jgi:DNA-binding transcriptional regulator YiaG|nr:hypothetical protein [Chitinispirillaceae bacterium]
MANVAQVLKAEITRISRKEIKVFVAPLHRSVVSLRKDVADLKRRVAELEKHNKGLSGILKETIKEPKISTEVMEKARFTGKSVQKIRAKLGLSQESFAKLVGISSQNVFVMEHKAGRLKLRATTLKNLLAVRNLGKREAQQRLNMLAK